MKRMESSHSGKVVAPPRRLVKAATITLCFLSFHHVIIASAQSPSQRRRRVHRSLKQDQLTKSEIKALSNDVNLLIFDDDWVLTTSPPSASSSSLLPTVVVSKAASDLSTAPSPAIATTEIPTPDAAKRLSSTPTFIASSSTMPSSGVTNIIHQPLSSITTAPTTSSSLLEVTAAPTARTLQPSSQLATTSTTSPTMAATTSSSSSLATTMAPTSATNTPPPSPINSNGDSINSSTTITTSPSAMRTSSPTSSLHHHPSTASPTRNNGTGTYTPSIHTTTSQQQHVPSFTTTGVPSSPSPQPSITISSSRPSLLAGSNSVEPSSTQIMTGMPSLQSSQEPSLQVVRSEVPTIMVMKGTVEPTTTAAAAAAAEVVTNSPTTEGGKGGESLSPAVVGKASLQPSSTVTTTSSSSPSVVTSSFSPSIVTDSSQSTSSPSSLPPSNTAIVSNQSSSSSTTPTIATNYFSPSTITITQPPSTHNIIQNNNSSSLTINSCPEGTCPNPNDRTQCQSKVQCLINPCEVVNTSYCASGEVCQVNYCGGCYAICVKDDDDDDSQSDVIIIGAEEAAADNYLEDEKIMFQQQQHQQPLSVPTAEESMLTPPREVDDDGLTQHEMEFDPIVVTTTNPPTTTSTLVTTLSNNVQVPKLTFTLIETLGKLSPQAVKEATLSIETFLSAQFDNYYNMNDGEAYFLGIHLNVMQVMVVARSAPVNDGSGRQRRNLRNDEVLIGTEMTIIGEVNCLPGVVPPTSAEIASRIGHFGRLYNDELVSNITSTGHSELEGVHLVEVGYSPSSSSSDDESLLEQTLPVQNDEGGKNSSSGRNVVSGMKMGKMDSDRYNRFIVIATVTGVATLTFVMFAFTSRDRRDSRGATTREAVTVPISVEASGGSRSRSRSILDNGSKGEEEDSASDPYIKCHKKGDSHISDLTTLASQPFARIVRSQSELDKDVESLQAYPVVDTHCELEREYGGRKQLVCDEAEEGHFVNGRCNTLEDDGHYVNDRCNSLEDDGRYVTRVRSCYTQDYSGYYNSNRSRSQEERERSSNAKMETDGSYLHRGWHASNEGGFWNSLTNYHRKSMESSIEGTLSVSAHGGIKQLDTQSSDVGFVSVTLSRASEGSRDYQLSDASTPSATNMSTASSFKRESPRGDSMIEQSGSHHSLERNSSKSSSPSPSNYTLQEEWLKAMHGGSVSSLIISNTQPDSFQSSKSYEGSSSSSPRNDTLTEEWLTSMHGDGASAVFSQAGSPQSLSQTNSGNSSDTYSPRNNALPHEWLMAMHGDGRSVFSPQPDSHQSLGQATSKSSENFSSSLLPRNDALPEEWLTALHGDDTSLVVSMEVKSSHDEKTSRDEKSGGFINSLDCGSGEEEDSEPSIPIHLHNRTEKRSKLVANEDAFSGTSSDEEESQLPSKEAKEREVNMRDSADLLSLVDSIVGESFGPGPSLADLVWLEERIREKDMASGDGMRRMAEAESNSVSEHSDDEEEE